MRGSRPIDQVHILALASRSELLQQPASPPCDTGVVGVSAGDGLASCRVTA